MPAHPPLRTCLYKHSDASPPAAPRSLLCGQVIEEERAKVEARTPVTCESFAAWHAKKVEARRLAREAKDAERKKKGILNGREIFMQVGRSGTAAVARGFLGCWGLEARGQGRAGPAVHVGDACASWKGPGSPLQPQQSAARPPTKSHR
jgi:hypothetical protein